MDNPCGLHGVCFDSGNDYRCHCFSNWTGPNCSLSHDQRIQPRNEISIISNSNQPTINNNQLCPDHECANFAKCDLTKKCLCETAIGTFKGINKKICKNKMLN